MRLKTKYFLLGCISLFALASCTEEESELPGIENENVMVKLTAVIDSKEFSTDNEIVPMRATRAFQDIYNVAYIDHYTMIVIKNISNFTWVIEKMQKFEPRKYIINQNGFGATIQQTLRPGIYKFLLLMNGKINENLKEGLTFTENEIPWLTHNVDDYSVFDIFFAIEDVEIKKTEQLQEHSSVPVQLKLKRYSSLIRFAFNGKELFTPPNTVSTIKYEMKYIISGLDMFGQDVQAGEEQSFPISKLSVIKEKSYSLINGQELHFSFLGSENKLINLLSRDRDKGKEVCLTIKGIGDLPVTQPYSIPVITYKNKITTILFQKESSGSVNISHEILEKVPDGWMSSIPWGFIELNNNY